MGSGHIEPRPGGKYRVRVRIAGKRSPLGTFDTREEAEDVLASALEKLEDRRQAAAGAVTLRDWIARWVPARERTRAVRDSRNDGNRMDAYVLCEPWSDDPIETVGPRAVRAWMLALLSRPVRQHGRPLSRSTVVAVLSTLRVCFRDAMAEGLLDANPCDGLQVPKAPSSDDEPWTYLRLEEIARLTTDERISERARLLYTVAIYTGLRKGELWGLRWRDVELEHVSPHVMVRRSRTGPTKTGKRRAVPLLPAALDAFDRLRALDASSDADALVFAHDGEMRGRSTHAGWRSRWKTYRCADGTMTRAWVEGHRELAGIDRPVRFHDLRHTCASHLRMGSWTERPMDLGDIQAWLGHSSQAMSLRYAHLAPDYLLGRAVPKPSPAPAAPAVIVEDLPGRRRKRMATTPPCDSAELAANGATVGPGVVQAAADLLRAARAGHDVTERGVDLAVSLLGAAAALPTPARESGGRP